jgi:hypothetical protein
VRFLSFNVSVVYMIRMYDITICCSPFKGGNKNFVQYCHYADNNLLSPVAGYISVIQSSRNLHMLKGTSKSNIEVKK